MKHVIIGVGAAGISAAKTIRSISKTDEIVMISSDQNVHSRCMLHKYISGQRNDQTIRFVPQNFFEENKIDWISGKAVTGIDTGKKLIKAGDETIDYDRLLIAAGSNSVIPPVGDLRSAKNVFGLRHLSDAKNICAAAKSAENIVVIGAGLVGLDAAWGLMELGKNVTIVEMGQSILPLNLTPKAAAPYQKLFEEHGCTFKLGRKVMGTEIDKTGNIKFVLLDCNESICCDIIVVAAGVRPAVEFLENSGIEYDRTITVDDKMQTNVENVYAAGDITGLSGIWPNASHQGQVAAKNMCGVNAVYDDRYAMKNTLNFYGLSTLSVGPTIPEEGDVVLVKEDMNNYRQITIKDGIIKGIILQGDISNSGFWQELIKRKVRVTDIKKDIWDLSYADFYNITSKGEYLWAI